MLNKLKFLVLDPGGGTTPLSRDVSASLSVSSTPAAHRPSEHTRAESRVLLWPATSPRISVELISSQSATYLTETHDNGFSNDVFFKVIKFVNRDEIQVSKIYKWGKWRVDTIDSYP